MTYYINEKKFAKNKNLQETYDDIVRYLNKTSSIIVENAETPLEKKEIMEILETQENPSFVTRLIVDHEKEVLHNVQQFSKDLLIKIEKLNLKSNEDILSTFSELSATLLELSNVDNYFNINKIIKAEIELSVKQAEQKILESDYPSILDIIELIYSDWIEEFIEELEIRKETNQ
ncbi:hypothetical protein GK047_22895 [Paenibacillus sp. SYP-B3998]|uniref:Uncharacterized protein n=1 Tax=Paenibacillus sp. SYP-B3998 TaxID=2678564 RepID=A0A6G4A4W6_9BACL|nr:hypothetical protein [Paenibacillus sp. SYP-B3998]NEW08849.1 hypothetical protein [Paenibacillus sp. SYP-B3998]